MDAQRALSEWRARATSAGKSCSPKQRWPYKEPAKIRADQKIDDGHEPHSGRTGRGDEASEDNEDKAEPRCPS